QALEGGADFIGCDAGSTDAGPYYLGSGMPKSSAKAVKRDLQLILREGLKHGLPVIVGSAGYSGGRPHLESVLKVVRGIAKENDWHFRLAAIDSEVPKETLLQAYRAGQLAPLDPAPLLTEDIIHKAERFVAMMGIEPFQQALSAGAQVVVAGRSSDVTIYASLPILRGIPKNVAYHAGKILECGAASVERRAHPDCMVAIMDEAGFTVEPPNPAMRCTPRSVFAHTLYENSDPFHLVESGGTLVTSDSRYTAVGDRAVHVTGSRFVPATEYTVKIEGAILAGYRSVVFAGIGDPLVIRQLDSYLAGLRTLVEKKVKESLGLPPSEYQLNWRVYGRTAEAGARPPAEWSECYERAILIDVVAATQAIASSINTVAWHTGLHVPIAEYEGLISNLAFPFSPPNISAGPVYRFCVNHIWNLHDPCGPFPVTMENI
ncbi:MAG: acyclic terpene utilization AtuA family protein, partial [Terriglobales bacterium]